MPDGNQLTFTLPKPVAAGSQLELQYDASAGTATVLPLVSSASGVSAETKETKAQAPDMVPSTEGSAPEAQTVSSGEIFSIQVPPGVECGQLLGISVPDGRQINIVLPEGKAAGSELRVWFDPATDTLIPIS
jgi:hypothetical protein